MLPSRLDGLLSLQQRLKYPIVAKLSYTVLVSYDVTSLFTNIQLQEAIDIALSNLIVNHNPNLNITKKELNFFFLFATSQTHFTFLSFIIKPME